MVANPEMWSEYVRVEHMPLENRLPEEWRKWRRASPQPAVRIKRMPQAANEGDGGPMKVLVVLSCTAALGVGEQIVIAPDRDAQREFRGEVRFVRLVPGRRWIVGVRVLVVGPGRGRRQATREH